MIKITEFEKQIINELDHPVYTVEFIEKWINRETNVLINPVAALRVMSVHGYYEAVHRMAKRQRKYGKWL